MRKISTLALLLVLSGCNVINADEGAQAEGPAADGSLIECAIAGAAWFAAECTVERIRVDGTLFLMVRHSDGGFRRFEVLTDGRGLAVADGAEQTVSEVVDGRLDVSVGSDRYRFPATIQSNDPNS